MPSHHHCLSTDLKSGIKDRHSWHHQMSLKYWNFYKQIENSKITIQATTLGSDPWLGEGHAFLATLVCLPSSEAHVFVLLVILYFSLWNLPLIFRTLGTYILSVRGEPFAFQQDKILIKPNTYFMPKFKFFWAPELMVSQFLLDHTHSGEQTWYKLYKCNILRI